MIGLIEQLRDLSTREFAPSSLRTATMLEAAAEIERLRADVLQWTANSRENKLIAERLATLLREIRQLDGRHDLMDAKRIAERAFEQSAPQEGK